MGAAVNDIMRYVLLLHPSLASHRIWEDVRTRLAPGMQVAAPDMPGHGQAPDADPSRDFGDQYVDAVAPLLRPGTDLVGHSYSAVIALRLAMEHPAQVRSLTLIEPVFFAAARAAGDPAYDAIMEASAPFEKAVEGGDRQAAARMFTAIWGAGDPWEALPDRARAALTARIHLIPAGNPALHDDRTGLLAPGRLEALDLPVLLIRGDRSPPVVAAIHRALRARLPDTREVVVEGAGHMLTGTHGAQVGDAIARFLSQPERSEER